MNTIDYKTDPCPFCGVPACETKSFFKLPISYFQVMCFACQARGPIAQNRNDAIESWNKRRFYEKNNKDKCVFCLIDEGETLNFSDESLKNSCDNCKDKRD